MKTDDRIEFIGHAEIAESLVGDTRQYLAGNLGRPQRLNEIFDEQLEIGVTAYEQEQAEAPHFHERAHEYHLVLEGCTQYLDMDTGKEYMFRKGDFYVIRPKTSYVQRSKNGTKIFFIKAPAGNDKVTVPATSFASEWMKSTLPSVRKDYYYATDAPMANSIKPAVAVALIQDGRLLMLRRRDNGKWTMPGGTHEFGESLAQSAIREIREETGFEVALTDIVGTYSDPNIRIAYNDGEVRQEFTIVYLGEIINGQLSIDSESTQAEWVLLDKLEGLDIARSQQRRIADLIVFLRNGRRAIR